MTRLTRVARTFVILGWSACMVGFDAERVRSAAQAGGGAWLGHPGAQVSRVEVLAGGKLGAFVRVVATEGPGAWDGWFVLDDGAPVAPTGPRGASDRLRALQFDGAGVSAAELARWLDVLGALPPGFEAADAFTTNGEGQAATLTPGAPVALVLWAAGHAYDARTTPPSPFGDLAIGQGVTPPRWAKAVITFDRVAGLAWTVEDRGVVVARGPSAP